jgi:branched-chain amino acid transport system permease protein
MSRRGGNPVSTSLFFQLLANGIMSGGMYALVASGLTLTLGVVKVFNFSQGDFLMLGAYGTFSIVVLLGMPYPVALIASLVAMAILGALVYLGIIQRALKFGFFNPLLITVLLVTIIEQTAVLTFASQTRVISPVIPGTLNISGVVFSKGKLLVIACSIIVLVALWYFMKLKVGKAMLASAENPEVATLQGINSKQIFWITMAVGCGLSGIAGAIVVPVYGAYQMMGTIAFSRALLVLMVGGMGSMSGALIGAFLIGIVESFAFQFVGYWNLIVILILVGILMFFRPGGLLGKPMPVPGE